MKQGNLKSEKEEIDKKRNFLEKTSVFKKKLNRK